MYKTFLHIFLLILISTTSGIAQNLVFNGDFEIYDTCPIGPSGPGSLQIEHCTGWTAPTKLGTSDYFNVCNTGSVGVPNNIIGYQPTHNGNGYCGIFTWDVDFGFEYREYLQTKLAQPLVTGNKYQLSFYVSNQGFNYSLEKIGALFSANDFNGNNYNPIIATPQVVNQNGFLTDSLGWTRIEGDFIANGGEEFVTIGYFENSLTVSDTLRPQVSGLISLSSYYLIDGVELIDITTEEEEIPTVNDSIVIPNVFTPNKDGYNDDFQLHFDFTTAVVYNRWGQIVFQSVNNDAIWDGRTNTGTKVPEGTYYYIITTAEELHKGYVQLLR